MDTNKDLIESKTHLLLDSKNKIDKVSKWNKERLLKAIEIFTQKEGQYFSLLEKIYRDDKNFAPTPKGDGSYPKVKTRFHNINETFRKYEPEELTKLIKEIQKEKFHNLPCPNEASSKEFDIKLQKSIRKLAIERLNKNTFLEVNDDLIWKHTIDEEVEKINKEIENGSLTIDDFEI